MSVFSAKISAHTMVLFCRQMAQTYDAGIPLLSGLKLAAAASRDRKLHRVVSRMRESIGAGATLQQATEQERRYWPDRRGKSKWLF